MTRALQSQFFKRRRKNERSTRQQGSRFTINRLSHLFPLRENGVETARLLLPNVQQSSEAILLLVRSLQHLIGTALLPVADLLLLPLKVQLVVHFSLLPSRTLKLPFGFVSLLSRTLKLPFGFGLLLSGHRKLPVVFLLPAEYAHFVEPSGKRLPSQHTIARDAVPSGDVVSGRGVPPLLRGAVPPV